MLTKRRGSFAVVTIKNQLTDEWDDSEGERPKLTDQNRRVFSAKCHFLLFYIDCKVWTGYKRLADY